MLRSIELTFTDGKVNEKCHVATKPEVFDAEGNSAGFGMTLRSVVGVADDGGINSCGLTTKEKTAVKKQLAEVRADWTIHTPPAPPEE